MYKDKEAQKEANKQASQRYRAKGMTEGMTKEGMTQVRVQGMTQDAGQQLHPGAVPGAKILSDGQLWYPGNNGYHPIKCRCDAHPDRTTMTDGDYKDMVEHKEKPAC